MSEHNEQCALFEWAKLEEGHRPALQMLFAVPNGGWRAKSTAVYLKAEGVRPGIPDVWLPVPRGPYMGLVIEMKFGNNVPGSSQKEWLNGLTSSGWSCHVCYCFEAARMAILWYLSLNKPGVFLAQVHRWRTEDDFNLEPRPPGAYE